MPESRRFTTTKASLIALCALGFALSTGCEGRMTSVLQSPGDTKPDHTPDDPVDEPDDPIVSDDPIVPDDPVDQEPPLGRTSWRRLSPYEVESTVVDMFAELGIREGVMPALLATPSVRHQFSNTSDVTLFTENGVRFVMEWSERVSPLVTRDAEARHGCTLTDQWDACAQDVAAGFARVAWRRPLTDDDLAEFERVWLALAPTEGADVAARALVEFALQSPDFWYLSADVRDDGETLTSHALASRLSYALWGSMPDAELRAIADEDGLRTPEQVRAVAARMLDDERARDAILRFHEEWLHLKSPDSILKNPELFPDFGPEVAQDLREEYERYVMHAFTSGQSVSDLLGSREGWVNTRVESIYGLDPLSSGPDDWVLRDLGDERAGIFTKGWFLASTAGLGESALIHRGVAIMERVLCVTVEPPDDVSQEAVDIPDDASSGKMLGVNNRASKPRCAACHDVIDPLGVAFETFDAVGTYRTSYPDGVAIEPAGSITRPEAVTYEDAAELMGALAQTPTASACYASKWVEWGTGLKPDASEAAEVARIASSSSLRELVLEVTTSSLFMKRKEYAR